MMNVIIQVIGLACLTNILVEAVPIKMLKDKTGLTTSSKYPLVSFTAQLLGCALCLGTYIGIIAMMSFTKGAIVAVVAELINKKINTYNI